MGNFSETIFLCLQRMGHVCYELTSAEEWSFAIFFPYLVHSEIFRKLENVS